jgi:hypothetical protein
MKYSLLAVLTFLSFSLSAQDTLKYKELRAGKEPMGHYSCYLAKDGHLYHIGEPVKLGEPYKGYGFHGYRSQFKHIREVMGPYLTVSSSHQVVYIKKIIVEELGTKGYFPLFITSGVTQEFDYILNVEDALSRGELMKSLPYTMSQK